MQQERILSVSELNELVKMTLDSADYLSHIAVRGEISNFTNRTHLYFSLKDENSVVRAVMFSSSAAKLGFRPENGMKVIAFCRLSAYIPSGQYQLYVERMEPDGIGALTVAYEQLKKKLESEGLFLQSHKKPLPRFPETVGIITSPTGAAFRDIINVSRRRYPSAKLLLFPALVQGDGAAAQLCSGVRYLNRCKLCDVIILGRGGGSIEDLWAFNDETLARTVYESEIPVISAVGHEIDYTICDFVADLRAPTPSAAAELALPDREALRRQLRTGFLSMEAAISTRITSLRSSIASYSQRKCLKSATYYVDDKRLFLISQQALMEHALRRKLDLYANSLKFSGSRLYSSVRAQLDEKKRVFQRNEAKLDALSPLSVFRRGYSAVFSEDGKAIRRAEDLSLHDQVTIRFEQGEANAEILNVKGKGNTENG